MKLYGLEKIKDEEIRKRYESLLTSPLTQSTYQTTEFSLIPNPVGVYPEVDIYPLAEKLFTPTSRLTAILTDMDGTTTTTEALCLHSLEYMVQKMTKTENGDPITLDPQKDYPHIIGNSTTKHVEYLLQTYGQHVDTPSLFHNWIRAVIWTLRKGKDENRRKEAKQTIQLLSLPSRVHEFIIDQSRDTEDQDTLLTDIPQSLSFSLQVRMAIEIYYQRYHEILLQIADGKSDEIASSLLGGNKPIEPMRGIGILLALCKGVLGEEVTNLFPHLSDKEKETLRHAGVYFTKHPAKVALVTSSIFYEANIVLSEVFRILSIESQEWSVSDTVKEKAKEIFSDYHNLYSAVITATDSNEIRLKPHRDLYSIALYTLGIPSDDFSTVFGFEDSESGLLAIRAAGIGRAVGVPFDSTKGHNLEAASVVLTHGIPEFITNVALYFSPSSD